MRKIAVATAVALALAACGEGPLDPGSFAVDGSWVGVSDPFRVVLELDQDAANRVSGTGTVYGLREGVAVDTLPVEVEGVWEYPDIDLVLRAPGYAPAVYDARFVTTDSITGTLQGSGFSSLRLALERQRPGSPATQRSRPR